jgi:glycosyltransferase involved in cell wall biosynthesis
MPRIVFVSPIPPMKTGTARYLGLFIDECADVVRDFDCLIVSSAELGPLPEEYKGIWVRTHSEYVSNPDDIIIAFFANNEFHRFVYFVLDSAIKRKKLICIIHETQNFMNVSAICSEPSNPLDMRPLLAHLKYEPTFFQNMLICSRRREFELPLIMHYNIMAHSRIIETADYLVVHSFYAAIKFALEGSHHISLPDVIVMQHPNDHIAAKSKELPTKEKFVVGCFGWISRAKRPISVMKGFAKFFEELPLDARRLVELKFVGTLVEESYNPISWSQKLGFPDHCVYLGHISDDRFAFEMASLSLLLNLRFPSCGETSGTLNLARDLGIRTAVSSYQAFREEKADYHISISPDKEIGEVCSVISREYNRWLNGTSFADLPVVNYPDLPPKFSSAQAMRYIMREFRNDS